MNKLVKPSGPYSGRFTLSNATGAAVNADSLPTVSAFKNTSPTAVTSGSWTVTCTGGTTGEYILSATLPGLNVFSYGDTVFLEVLATIGGVVAREVVDKLVVVPDATYDALILGTGVLPADTQKYLGATAPALVGSGYPSDVVSVAGHAESATALRWTYRENYTPQFDAITIGGVSVNGLLVATEGYTHIRALVGLLESETNSGTYVPVHCDVAVNPTTIATGIVDGVAGALIFSDLANAASNSNNAIHNATYGLQAILTAAAGALRENNYNAANNAGIAAALEALASIDAKTTNLPASPAATGDITAAQGDIIEAIGEIEAGGATASELAAAILAHPTNKLTTDSAGRVTPTITDLASLDYLLTGEQLCGRADIEAVFGVENVKKWADLDNDGDADKINARISRGIVWATGEAYSLLRSSPYAIPLTGMDTNSTAIMVNLGALLAGVWLYEARGVVDYDPDGHPMHRLKFAKDEAERIIRDIMAGKRRLVATLAGRGKGGNIPIVGR